MKKKFLLIAFALVCTALLASEATAPARPAPSIEELQYLSAINRMHAVQLGRYSPDAAAYFNGRADAYADVATWLEAQPQ